MQDYLLYIVAIQAYIVGVKQTAQLRSSCRNATFYLLSLHQHIRVYAFQSVGSVDLNFGVAITALLDGIFVCSVNEMPTVTNSRA